MNDDNRNLIAFIVTAALMLFAYMAYSYVFVEPAARQAARAHQATVAAQAAHSPEAVAAKPPLTRGQAVARGPRVVIDTPALTGSLSLRGARFDDLFLKKYHTEVSNRSPLVELLKPEGTAEAWFAEAGWVGANLAGLPTSDTVWTLQSGSMLAPGHPVILTYAAPSGLAFTRRIEVDADALFTLTDTIANSGAAAATLSPYGSVKRLGLPAGLGRSGIVHEGGIGVLGVGEEALRLSSYKDMKKKGAQDFPSRGGWLGITDKYWMAAFVPAQSERLTASFREGAIASPSGPVEAYEAAWLGVPTTLAPGSQTTRVSHLFAGAKVVPALKAYGRALGAPRFDDAVDWGHLWFLTKPIFLLLDFFFQRVGNFGVAILMLTVVIRLVTFPLANSGFEMGVKMKKIQPEMKAIQSQNKEDPAGQQKAMMALYAREKVNPVTGCLPILLQIPLFYCLTKVFTVTIEMYHAPFFGWIHDLSARDPTTIVNLFGLIPWDPGMTPVIGGLLGGLLHVGVWPLAYGASMWLSQAMTPQAGVDPTQQAIFRLMPLFFTFILAQYAVGLLIYWTWSSLITIVQQYLLMRRHKVDNPIDDFVSRFRAPARAP